MVAPKPPDTTIAITICNRRYYLREPISSASIAMYFLSAWLKVCVKLKLATCLKRLHSPFRKAARSRLRRNYFQHPEMELPPAYEAVQLEAASLFTCFGASTGANRNCGCERRKARSTGFATRIRDVNSYASNHRLIGTSKSRRIFEP